MTRRPTRPAAPVPSRFYSADLLRTFAAGEHEAFLAGGGRPLRPRLARSLALAALRPGLTVVDVGAGRGEAAAHAARRGADVTAVDYSPDGLALARRTANVVAPGSVRRGRLRFVVADVTALPLASGCADRVLLLDVAEHLHPWQLRRAMGEVRRILRPGGYVVIHTLPNRWALAVAYPVLRIWAPDLPAQARSGYERAVHVNEQDPRRLRRALGAVGLEARVWVEEWTTLHARRGGGLAFPDRAREAGYPALRRPGVRRAARWLMRSPAAPLVGNDVFALAWLPGGDGPPRGGRFRPVR